MAPERYDIVIIGGGLAGSSLARNMASAGARVLVLERETVFRDRVRGEAVTPWGVGEARLLGVYDLLRDTCGHEQPWADFYTGPHLTFHRDLLTTTPQGAPFLSFYHPRAQETLIAEAERTGVHVRRGANAVGIEGGKPPRVSFVHDGKTNDVEARLVVAADGRVSQARKWGCFEVRQDPPTLLLAGILLDNVEAPEDTNYLMTNPFAYRGAFLFPQGGGRARAYFAYPVDSGYRLQGDDDLPLFVSECTKAGVPEHYYRSAKAAGPLASFEVADTWAPHPYRNGVALVGDAASSSDPSWGNGISLSLRDVRMLRDALLASDDWEAAGHAYADAHDRVYGVIHNVTTWSRQFFLENTPEAEARRARAMPLIAQDPSRIPDHGIGGPDLPFDEKITRARFFGE